MVSSTPTVLDAAKRFRLSRMNARVLTWPASVSILKYMCPEIRRAHERNIHPSGWPGWRSNIRSWSLFRPLSPCASLVTLIKKTFTPAEHSCPMNDKNWNWNVFIIKNRRYNILPELRHVLQVSKAANRNQGKWRPKHHLIEWYSWGILLAVDRPLRSASILILSTTWWAPSAFITLELLPLSRYRMPFSWSTRSRIYP